MFYKEKLQRIFPSAFNFWKKKVQWLKNSIHNRLKKEEDLKSLPFNHEKENAAHILKMDKAFYFHYMIFFTVSNVLFHHQVIIFSCQVVSSFDTKEPLGKVLVFSTQELYLVSRCNRYLTGTYVIVVLYYYAISSFMNEGTSLHFSYCSLIKGNENLFRPCLVKLSLW